MKLKHTTYKTIEIIEDDEYGMVIGNIVMDDSKLLYAEIVDSTICERSDLEKMRAFLDEVDNAMTPDTTSIFSLSGADVTSRSVEMDIRCS